MVIEVVVVKAERVVMVVVKAERVVLTGVTIIRSCVEVVMCSWYGCRCC